MTVKTVRRKSLHFQKEIGGVSVNNKDSIAYIRKRGLELEIDFEGNESKGILALSRIEFVAYDSRTDKYRALPMVFWDIKEALEHAGYTIETNVNTNHSISGLLFRGELRDYQLEAVNKLKKKGFRGVIVLPTGAGKTLIGLRTIYEVSQKTLIVVPTIDLMEQWKNRILEILGFDRVCVWGGSSRSLCDITIATYQGASRKDFLLRSMDMFNLIIFDEAHHLPAKTYLEIAKRLIARFRVGLTATPERVDNREQLFPIFVGEIYRIAGLKELVSKGYLSDFEYKLIKVRMEPDEAKQYRELMKIYDRYVEENFKGLSGRLAFERVVKRAWMDRNAKDALEARMKAKAIAMAPREKIRLLDSILRDHRSDKVLIFTRFQRTAFYISYLFGIPVITSKTPKSIRKRILDMFRRGDVSKLVSAEALDEGIDVPDARVGIIISGTSSQRQLIQRIGRLLRPKDSKAIIYELVTKRSYEEFISKRRRGGIS